jgi:phosphatidylserine/phosphatidylglycerophosphate/cardiolipin synthase-like enzyme
VSDLHVSIGTAARGALCDAFASARRSIDAQFYSLSDPDVLNGLNAAAQRGVKVTIRLEGDAGRYDHRRAHTPADEHVRASFSRYAKLFDPRVHVIAEADPLELEHAKAAVIDDARAFVGTANPNPDGFASPGEVLIEDDEPRDIAAIESAIDHALAQTSRVISGPDPSCRSRVDALLAAPVDERIASERLSDPRMVDELVARHARGLHDRVLVNTKGERPSQWLEQLVESGVDVRTIANQYMHDKYVDAVDRIYVGSANLTRNGLDEAREIGLIADAGDFDDGGAAMRHQFDVMWSAASPLTAEAPPAI